MDEIGNKLNQLAERILDEILESGNGTTLDQQIDVLKAVGTLHLGMKKINAKLSPDDDEGAASVPAMRAKLKSVGGS